MADEIISGLRGIKKELKDVQDRMVGLSAGSDEFVKLSQRAGELRDKMKDVKEAVNSNAGPAIESFGNNLGIAQGQLMSLDLEGFGDSMKRMAGNVKAVDFKTFKDGISSIGDGLGSLGKALLSNPIFWIAGAIAGAVAAMNYFSEKEAERIKAIQQQREQDLANYKKDNELRIVQANGAAEKVYAIRMQELQREQAYHGAILQVAKDSHDKNIALTEEWQAKEKESQQKYNDLRIEMEKLTQERLNALTAKRADIDKQFSLVGLTERQKTNKLLKDEYDEALRQIAALGGSAEDVAKISAIYREKQRKIDQANAKEDQANYKAAQEQKERDAKAQREKDADKNHYEIESIKAKDATLVSSAVKTMELQTTLTAVTISEEKKRTIAERKAAEERREIFNSLWYAKYDIAKATTDAMVNLNNALTESGIISAEKGFKIGKALSIAQATISTIQGVQNALSAASTIPEPFGTALKAVNAVSIAAAGAANIAKIAKTQFNSGGQNMDKPSLPSPSGGAMGGGGGQSPASLNLSGLQGNTSVAPLQTYVLAGQVSGAQQAEFKIKNTASILGGG